MNRPFLLDVAAGPGGLVIATRDRLWTMGFDGADPVPLTDPMLRARHPVPAPDGRRLAFTGSGATGRHLFILDLERGEVEPVIAHGRVTAAWGWSNDGLYFTATEGDPFGLDALWVWGPDEREVRRLDLGPVEAAAIGEDALAVVPGSRNRPLWSGYAGGRDRRPWIGVGLPVDADTAWRRADAACTVLAFCKGALYGIEADRAAPAAVDGSWRPRLDGDATALAGFGSMLYCIADGDLYRCEPGSASAERVPVVLRPRAATTVRVPVADRVEHVASAKDGCAVTARGRLIVAANPARPPRRIAVEDARLRFGQGLADGRIAALAVSVTGSQRLMVFGPAGRPLHGGIVIDAGPVEELRLCPAGRTAALADASGAVRVLDLASGELTTVDLNGYGPGSGLAWSPDGDRLAYAVPVAEYKDAVRIWDRAAGTVVARTEPVLRDSAPAFDAAGATLYYLGTARVASTAALTPPYLSAGATRELHRARLPAAQGRLVGEPTGLRCRAFAPAGEGVIAVTGSAVVHLGGDGRVTPVAEGVDDHWQDAGRLFFLRAGVVHRCDDERAEPVLDLRESSVTIEDTERLQVFGEARSVLRQRFHNPAAAGPDRAPTRRYADLIARTASDAEFTHVFDRYLHDLGSSHVKRVAPAPPLPADPDVYPMWTDQNRAEVDRASRGAVGYLHVPDTGANGHGRFLTELLRQHPRAAWIVDLRFNQGGHGATVFLETLRSPDRYLMARRDGSAEARPAGPRPSPAVFLVNEYTGSDGELLAWMVRDAGLGPLIGVRTAGAAVGVRRGHLLADGSRIVFPEYAFTEPAERDLVPAEPPCQNARRGRPLSRIENHGVDPDVHVPLTPADDRNPGDPQLAAAIRRALDL